MEAKSNSASTWRGPPNWRTTRYPATVAGRKTNKKIGELNSMPRLFYPMYKLGIDVSFAAGLPCRARCGCARVSQRRNKDINGCALPAALSCNEDSGGRNG